MRQQSKMHKSLQSVVLFLTFSVIGYEYNPRMLKHKCSSVPQDEVTCHDTYIKNDLRSADKFEFPEKSIFFVETSCKGDLDSRQACSVESAARAHPNWQINVLFAGPVPARCRQNPALSTLRRYGNIKFLRIHSLELAKGTPLEDFLNMNPLETSDWPVSHASDILRYLILYKWSGVYLDLDVIVLRPFDGLAKNWAAKEMMDLEEVGVGSGALAFSGDKVGRTVAATVIEQMKDDFRGWIKNYNGPYLIFRALRRICSVNHPEKMSFKKCQGFAVYDVDLFNPVSYYDAEKLFNEGQLDLGSPYTCHVWASSMSHNMCVHPQSPYAALATRYCPRIHARYGPFFYLLHE